MLEEKSFDILMAPFVPKAKSFLRKSFHFQDCDVDDVVQLSLLKVWKKYDLFQGRSSFSTWFFSIVKHEALNFIYKKKRLNETELFGEYDFIDDVDRSFTKVSLNFVEKREEMTDCRDRVLRCYEKMTPPHRQIIKLSFEDGLTYKEISKTLGIPVGTVMSRLYLAKKSAKQILNANV